MEENKKNRFTFMSNNNIPNNEEDVLSENTPKQEEVVEEILDLDDHVEELNFNEESDNSPSEVLEAMPKTLEEPVVDDVIEELPFTNDVTPVVENLDVADGPFNDYLPDAVSSNTENVLYSSYENDNSNLENIVSENHIDVNIDNQFVNNLDNNLANKKNKDNKSNVNVEEYKNNSKHINFETRLVFNSVIVFTTFIIGFVFLFSAVNYKEKNSIRYSEIVTPSYNVCLNPDDYYNGKCVGEGKEYLSVLTNNIPINFRYLKTFSEPLKYDFNYYVIGKLTVYDRDNASKILLEENKMLIHRTRVNGNDAMARFETLVDVPFKDLNNYVNGYKSKYSLSALSEYKVVLYVDDGMGAREVANVKVPLGNQTFGIPKPETVNVNNEILPEDAAKLSNFNTTLLVVGILFLLVSCGFAIRIFIVLYKVLNANVSPYEKKLRQILGEYDRVIVITNSEYQIDSEKQFIKVNSFFELLDARDALEKPIIYEKVNSVKSNFYVEDRDKVYRYTMKESDFQKPEKKSKKNK